MGVKYAKDNAEKSVGAYPKFEADCTNFVSQCMIASGIHYRSEWYIYRKNNKYNTPTNNTQTKNSWDLKLPGPWTVANNFKEYWISKSSKVYKAKGADIIANPSILLNTLITKGTVVQIANADSNLIGNSFHSMYITEHSGNTFYLTYHSENTVSKNLLDICKNYKDKYFLFFVF